MSQAQYRIYRQKVFDLANTLVVKSKATAYAINVALSDAGHLVNQSDPTTWKYYLNLNGQYHATDTVMTVTSLDTLQTIEFTRTNLQIHLATAREYEFGSDYYNELVKRYPTQENLIRGILHPVALIPAIEAEDGAILYYDRDLVEENETNLIAKLDQWTRNVMRRWNNTQYVAVDSLYPAAQLGIMFMQLVPEILNIRLENCHTLYAHSFHIRQFLAGQGRLDRFVDALTRKQLLWLYRNIRYIHRNVGKHATFETLLQHILTERGFPLSEWEMEHNTEDMLTEIYPDVEFVRRSLNTAGIASGAETNTIDQILEKEASPTTIPLAKGNSKNLLEASAETQRLTENSVSNRLKTKVLESSILDLTDAFPYTLADTLLNHWAYFAFKGQYRAALTIDNPATSGRLTLLPDDAFVVFVYAFNKARGYTLERPPIMEAIMIRKNPPPALATLRTMTERDHVSTALLQELYVGLHQLPNQYISIEGFYRSITEVYKNLMRHRFMWSSQHDYMTRGQLKGAALHFYANYPIDLGNSQTYDQWFASRGLDVAEYTESQLDMLATNILNAATGQDLRITMSLKDLQAALLRLMAQLSSYSIQFLQSINSEPIKVVDWGVIAPTVPEVEGHGLTQVNIINVRPLDEHALGRNHWFIDLAEIGTHFALHAHARGETFFDISLDYTSNTRPRGLSRMLIPRFDILSQQSHTQDVDDVVDRETDYYIPIDRVPLTDAFMELRSEHYALTPEERETLTERWEEWIVNNPTDPEDPNYVIDEPYLDGHDYPVWDLPQPYLAGHNYPTAPIIEDVTEPGPFVVEPVIAPTVTVTHTDFPNFDGLTSPAGEFTTQPLTLEEVMEGPPLPEVIMSPDMLGLDDEIIVLQTDMQGFGDSELINKTFLEGHTPPEDPETP